MREINPVSDNGCLILYLSKKCAFGASLRNLPAHGIWFELILLYQHKFSKILLSIINISDYIIKFIYFADI